MANQVFANNREISCKAADGKSICAFPDVCFTPPENPATPPGVPIPYPNTGLASDTSNGSTSVKISKKEVMLKNKSYFKRSMGDEAGCAAKKGVITSKNMGKVYFTMWSMDVKIEGENAVRMMDLTTHNHMSLPGNTPTWPYIDEIAISSPEHPCAEDIKREQKACEEYVPHGRKDPCSKKVMGASEKPSGAINDKEADALADRAAANQCLAARRCALQPYKSAKSSCCPQQTPHHLIEASALHDTGRGGSESTPVAGVNNYSEGLAPCVCAEGVNQNTGTHGLMHTFQSASAARCREGSIELCNGEIITEKKTTYGTAKKKAVQALKKTFPESGCSEGCITAQLDAYHNQCGITDRTAIKAVETGQSDLSAAEQAVANRSAAVQATRSTESLD